MVWSDIFGFGLKSFTHHKVLKYSTFQFIRPRSASVPSLFRSSCCFEMDMTTPLLLSQHAANIVFINSPQSFLLLLLYHAYTFVPYAYITLKGLFHLIAMLFCICIPIDVPFHFQSCCWCCFNFILKKVVVIAFF